MALRTADEYREGLRDGRRVFIMGKQVDDVTSDLYIKVGVETAAFDFIMGHDPEMKEKAVMADPETGEDISTYFELPDYPEIVAKRHELVKEACYYAQGALPFVKDVGSDIINGLTVAARLMDNKDYLKFAVRKDNIFLTFYTLIDDSQITNINTTTLQ